MQSHYTETDEKKLAELISVINLIKLRLLIKHGPSIKKKWARKERYDPAYKLVIPS